MYEYNAFGEIVQVLDEEGNPIPIDDAIPNLYTFTGREFDPETGLYYYRARYYDSRIGRFLQEDPIVGLVIVPQTLNKFPYVTNNPIKYIDPFGLINMGGVYKWIRPQLDQLLEGDPRHNKLLHWQLYQGFKQNSLWMIRQYFYNACVAAKLYDKNAWDRFCGRITHAEREECMEEAIRKSRLMGGSNLEWGLGWRSVEEIIGLAP
jgi:RHS repeat-associated protein